MVVIIIVARHNDPSTSTQKQVGGDESGSNSIKTRIGGAPNLNHEKDQLDLQNQTRHIFFFWSSREPLTSLLCISSQIITLYLKPRNTAQNLFLLAVLSW
ncbi:hypothetical protein V6N13_144997 [Hibiscus sabdariffa]|uniref:Uncharacterized protein n=1 Tax=Hibiscus sabdariffa TaxID=183260 RepID=A0ABR2FMT9_9ROSI